ncbi:MAG: glycosyltransferase [Legionella sp.]|nr:glycosyltransferase [Legionella sp.]
MKKEPLVSVLMNCYNGEKYLRQAIDSVLAQTYQNWEIIFWDNQSTDRSAEIFQSYKDARFKYFYAPKHTWLYEARNYALEKVSGDFIALLDVDDWWLPTKLEKQIPLFDDAEVGFVYGNYWVESELKKKRWLSLKSPIPTGWVLNDLLKSYFVGLPTLVLRRTALSTLNYLCDPRFHMIGDLDLVARLAISWKSDCVQEPVAFYRIHATNESAKHRGRNIDEHELWLSEIGASPVIQKCPSFQLAKRRIGYMKAVNLCLQREKNKAYALFNELPWGQLKIRLLLALLLPSFVFRKLKN